MIKKMIAIDLDGTLQKVTEHFPITLSLLLKKFKSKDTWLSLRLAGPTVWLWNFIKF